MERDERLAQLGTAMATRRSELVERIVRRTKSEVRDYAGVPAEELADRTAAEVNLWVIGMMEGRLLGETELLPTAPLAAHRARQGVTPEGITLATSIWAEEARLMLQDLIQSPGLEEVDITNVLLHAWHLTDLVQHRSADEIRRIREEVVEEADSRRRDFVIDLMNGRLTGAPLEAQAALLDLDPAAEYIGVMGRSLDPKTPTDEIRRELERTQGTLAPRLLALIDDAVVGLISQPPTGDLGTACWGRGEPGSLQGAAQSLASARVAFETAWVFRRSGIHTLESLGVLTAVAGDRRLGSRLAERFVAPAEELGQSGRALLDTVDAYLAHGMHVEETAAALHLHPNSVRKRLRRFQELASCDLREVEDIVGVWWALRWAETELGRADGTG